MVHTEAGWFYEAKNHADPRIIIARDLDTHTATVPEVLVLARALIDEDGWRSRTVSECAVLGCVNSRPMWAVGRGAPTECSSCSTRTVLACVECGAPDEAQYSHRERLLTESLCFYCDLWRRRLAEFSNNQIVADDWHLYSIGEGRGPNEIRGFGGRHWAIAYLDGRRRETCDLWDGGEIPTWFRDRFAATATLASVTPT